jgi:class 3 adenylate cyclase/tetratricopeptide (TPR) repeat protein
MPAGDQGDEGERKIVSILFCDLVGFTAMAESADPEDVRHQLMPYYRLVRECAEGFGGTVEKFVGDAVVAFFGVPVLHEDDAERAVRAGLRILEVLGDPAVTGRTALHVRVGVNTGEVFAVAAPNNPGEGVVAGDAVNTAARIQSVAPPDSVAVGPETFAATQHVIGYEPLPPVELKGKSVPVPIWKATTARSRLGSDALGYRASPMVGRRRQAQHLRDVLARVDQTERPHLVTVVGEAGIGKSHLVSDLAVFLDRQPDLYVWRQGRSLSYGEGMWALGEIVKAHAGIDESDAPDTVTAKLEQTLPADVDAPWMKTRLLALLGMDTAAPGERDEYFRAWARYLQSLGRPRPAVVVFEDLHWGGAALRGFLHHLARDRVRSRLLIICTSRPELFEAEPGWMRGVPDTSEIQLSPLTDDDMWTIVETLAGEKRLNARVRDALIHRADGNPLYAHEFVRMLRDRGGAEGLREDEFPPSLQLLIAARLDALPAAQKELLGNAAVVGRSFWDGALATLTGHDAEWVRGALGELTEREFIRPAPESSLSDEREFNFSHALIRDVAYASLPRPARARRHLAVVRWLEGKAGLRLEDVSQILVHHSEQAAELASAAGDTQLAAASRPLARRYGLMAADKVASVDPVAALARLGRVLELIDEDDREWADVKARWAAAARHVDRLREADEAYSQAVTNYERAGRQVAAGTALAAQASVRFYLGDATHASARQRAGDLLAEAPPSEELVAGLAELSAAAMLATDYRSAVTAADRSLETAAALALPVPGRALSSRGLSRAGLGDLSGGIADLQRAIEMLKEAGAGHDVAVCYNNLAVIRWMTEGPRAALQSLEEGISFAEERGLTSAVRHMKASSLQPLLDRGELKHALALADELSDELRHTGQVLATEAAAVRARVLLEQGEPAGADAAEELLFAPRPPEDIVYTVIVVLPVAMGRLARGDRAGAADILGLLEGRPDLADCEELAPRLPALVRAAVAAGSWRLAAHLVDRCEQRFPLQSHAIGAGRAVLLRDSEPAESLHLYREAARAWASFGNRLEEAYARLGAAEVLAGVGGAGAGAGGVGEEAQEQLAEARRIFASMGAGARVAECEAFLRRLS